MEAEVVETTAFEIPCLFVLSTTSAITAYFLSSYFPSLKAMADKRKAKGTKPTGQRKSATQGTDNDVGDKENAVTSQAQAARERPRPRPIKKSTVRSVPEHVERNRGKPDGDEGAAMAVEALLSIQKGKPFPAANPATKARCLSPAVAEHILQQVVPGFEDLDDIYGTENGGTRKMNNKRTNRSKIKSSTRGSL
jgi:hypothetical protein